MGVQGGPLGSEPFFSDGDDRGTRVAPRRDGKNGGGAVAGSWSGSADGDGGDAMGYVPTGTGSHSLRAARRRYDAGEMSKAEYDHLRHVLSPDNEADDLRDVESREYQERETETRRD